MELEDLDDSWIKEIDQDEKIYNKFYTSIPNYVNMYINSLNLNLKKSIKTYE